MEKSKKVMKRKHLANLHNNLAGLNCGKKYFKFNLIVGKNMANISDELIPGQEKAEPSEGYLKFEEEGRELEANTLKDEMVINGKKDFIIKDYPSYQENLSILTEKYKEEIDDFKEQQKGYREFMNEELEEFELWMIDQDNVPSDLSGQMISFIADIIIFKETKEKE